MVERDRRRAAAGFTMTELIVVVGIIAVMGAVAMPSLLAFIRNYAIESAAKELASEIQTARYKAISRNVNIGVLLVVLDNQSYRWVIEDDVDPQTAPNWTAPEPIANLLGRPDQLGVRKQLPTGLQFVAAGATDVGFRYNRYGGWCQPALDAECPAIDGGALTDYVENTVGGASILISQPSTGLVRRVRVGTGGRVIIEPS